MPEVAGRGKKEMNDTQMAAFVFRAGSPKRPNVLYQSITNQIFQSDDPLVVVTFFSRPSENDIPSYFPR